MAEECVVAVYGTPQAASEAVHILHRADFSAENIALVANEFDNQPNVTADLMMGDDSLRDAAIGAGLGGVLGILAGLSVMAVSGLGMVFLIGPVGGGIVGALSGGVVGSIAGWGVHESQIDHYQQCLKDNQVLVIAEGDPQEIARANRILLETDTVEVHLLAKTDSESSEIVN
jgi:hypothetical protein